MKCVVDGETIGRLIDVVEDWLTEKNILGLDDPMETIICGPDYDHLAGKFSEALGFNKDLQIGDQIEVDLNGFGKFTATVQKIHDDGYLFMFDECIAINAMNENWSNGGIYEKSDLCRWLNEEVLDSFPKSIRDRLSYISIPSYGQMFGHDEFYDKYIEQDNDEQFELMKKIQNRIGIYNNETIYTFLRNRFEYSSTGSDFTIVSYGGFATNSPASNSFGVRPIFFLKKEGVPNVEKVSG